VRRLFEFIQLGRLLAADTHLSPLKFATGYLVKEVRNFTRRFKMLMVVANKVESALAHVDTLIAEREVCFLRPTYEFVEVLPWANARQRRGCGDNNCDD